METKIVNHYLRDTGRSVLGLLTAYPSEENFASLQPSDFFNMRNVSCIPCGEFWIEHHISPTFGACLIIKGVPDRDNILVHAGNFWKNTKGCVLPGTEFAQLDQDGFIDVVNSTKALERLKELVPADGCPFIVQRDENFQSVFQ